MKVNALLLSVCGVFLSACQPPVAVTEQESESFSITGLHFGQSFVEVLSAIHPYTFHTQDIEQCVEEIPLRGCFASVPSDGTPFIIRDGIPFKLAIMVNKFDQLSGISLNYRTKAASNVECRDVMMRTADWIAEDFAPLAAPPSNIDTSRMSVEVTSKGHQLLFSASDPENWVTGPMFGAYRGIKIWLVGSYLTIGTAGHCDASVMIEDPSRPKFVHESAG